MTARSRDRWNERYAASELVWSSGPNDRLVEVLERLALPTGRALDIGCGEGRNAIWLAEQGWLVTAVDFAAAGVDKGRQIAARRGVEIDWVVDDVARWRAPRDSADLAVVLYLHTTPSERACWMAHTVDALKPGGAFVYIGHDLSNLARGHGGPQSPLVLPMPGDIVEQLDGCHVERAEVVERPVELEREHGGEDAGIALDALVVAFKLAGD